MTEKPGPIQNLKKLIDETITIIIDESDTATQALILLFCIVFVTTGAPVVVLLALWVLMRS